MTVIGFDSITMINEIRKPTKDLKILKKDIFELFKMVEIDKYEKTLHYDGGNPTELSDSSTLAFG